MFSKLFKYHSYWRSYIIEVSKCTISNLLRYVGVLVAYWLRPDRQDRQDRQDRLGTHAG